MNPNASPSPLELLQQTHTFPGPYHLKAIGKSDHDFRQRVVDAVREVLGVEAPSEVRETPGGRHISVSLDLNVESAEQVLAIHHRLKKLDGLVMLL
jgi:putative lipoic acid-binding regulatory protein